MKFLIIFAVLFFVSCSDDPKVDEEEEMEACTDGDSPVCFSGESANECSAGVDADCETVSCGNDSFDCWTKEYFDKQENNEEGCNAEQLACEDGYAPLFDPDPSRGCTTAGEGTCIASLEGFCLYAGVCDCSRCDNGPEVQSCAGDPDCYEVDSCGETKFCTSCANPTCFDRESVRTYCPTDAVCREEACASNSSPYFCSASNECPTTPDCPNGFSICAIESATCVSTKTCGTTLLCEAN